MSRGRRRRARCNVVRTAAGVIPGSRAVRRAPHRLCVRAWRGRLVVIGFAAGNSALRGKPVIVVQTLTDSACAIAASYAAKAFGIKTGTLVRDARRLCLGGIEAQCLPQLAFVYLCLAAVKRRSPVLRG
jgi:hypothetical protein